MSTTKVGLYRDKLRWSVRWFGDFDPDTGRQKRPCKSFRLKRDAERYQAAKQAEFDVGAKRDRPEPISIQSFCTVYMERRNHEWREKTRLAIEDTVDRLLTYFGGSRLLATISSAMAARFWSDARSVRSDRKSATLSAYTKNRILRDARTMFKYATTWGYVVSNPFDGLKLIRVAKRAKRAWHYIQPIEYMALLKSAPDLRWKAIYALAYTSGARFGELFNLTEDSLDFERGKLLIVGRPGSNELPPFHVKDHENREVPLPCHTLKLVWGWMRFRPNGSPLILLTPERYQRVIRRWRACRESGEAFINDYLVNNLLTSIRRHAQWAGIKLRGQLTMHGFRKSCGQNWANHLPMNVVKELMGHSSITTTAEFYSTVSEEHETLAQSAIQAITVGTGVKETDAKLTSDARFGLFRRVG